MKTKKEILAMLKRNISTFQLFNFSTLAIAVVAAMTATTAMANVPQVLTYRGVLLRSTGERKAEALSLTFRLYDSKAPETALWARTLRVPIDTNGVFYAELNDREGNDPDGIGRSLADAMGLVKGAPEIGLTPPDANELKPRQRLSTFGGGRRVCAGWGGGRRRVHRLGGGRKRDGAGRGDAQGIPEGLHADAGGGPGARRVGFVDYGA